MAAVTGKKQKKKWSKGKVKDKAVHAVIADKIINEKAAKEISVARILTVAVLVDRLKINGSLARRILEENRKNGNLVLVVKSSHGKVYKRPTPATAEE